MFRCTIGQAKTGANERSAAVDLLNFLHRNDAQRNRLIRCKYQHLQVQISKWPVSSVYILFSPIYCLVRMSCTSTNEILGVFTLWPTAAFFSFVAVSIAGMAIWERFSPGGAPRMGILRIKTTRGERLFISYLSSGFVHFTWLGFIGPPRWAARVLSVVLSVAICKWL